MEKQARIAVCGISGMVGSAIARALTQKGYTQILGTYHSRRPTQWEKTVTLCKVDLTDQQQTNEFFDTHRPEYVFLAAAKVGGILANNTYKAEFIHDNLAIAVNVIHASYRCGVKKLLNLGSSCIYPKMAPQPLKEEYLLSGPLEPTNEPYAIAKIAAIKLCRYYNEQYGTNFISVMPTNLYGPGDNFNLETSHVLPALIRKFHLAKLLEQDDFEGIKKDFEAYPIGFGWDEKINLNDRNSIEEILSALGIKKSEEKNQQPSVSVTIWGSGEVYREFLYVDDLAEACVYLMEKVDAYEMKKISQDYFVNIGVGEDIKIKDIAVLIKQVVGFQGYIVHDLSKPDGTPRKLLDVGKINLLGWEAKIDLEEGMKKVYKWYLRYSEC